MRNPYPVIKECDLIILSSKYSLQNVLRFGFKKIYNFGTVNGSREILDNGKGGFLFKGDHNNCIKNINF